MMLLLHDLLADTVPAVAPADTVSLTALGTFLAAVAGIVMTYLKRDSLKDLGRQEERARKVVIDGQPLEFKQSSQAATHSDLTDLKRDTDQRLTRIEESLAAERAVARTALGNIHARLDKSTVATANLQGQVEEVGKNVARLLDLALARKSTTRP